MAFAEAASKKKQPRKVYDFPTLEPEWSKKGRVPDDPDHSGGADSGADTAKVPTALCLPSRPSKG